MNRDEAIALIAALGATAVVLWIALRSEEPAEPAQPKRTCTDALLDTTAGGMAGASAGGSLGSLLPGYGTVAGAGAGLLGGIGYSAASDLQFQECAKDTMAYVGRWAARNPDEAVEIALLLMTSGIALPIVLTKEIVEFVFGEDVFGLGGGWTRDETSVFHVVATDGAKNVRAIPIHGAGTVNFAKWPVEFRLHGLDYAVKRKPDPNERLILKAYSRWLLTHKGISVSGKNPRAFVQYLQRQAEHRRKNPPDLHKPPRKP